MPEARKIVLHSIETVDGDRCVDIFRCGDGSFGFEGYRRDVEDTSGWFRVTHFGEQRYSTEAAAMSAARRMFPWLPISVGASRNV